RYTAVLIRAAENSSKPYTIFYSATATTEIYTLSLHDALPISPRRWKRLRTMSNVLWLSGANGFVGSNVLLEVLRKTLDPTKPLRSEEHTSELQSRENLVCRLLLEKKK